MKLSHLNKSHFFKAFQEIDSKGYWSSLWNQYWIRNDGKEYPFKLTVLVADKYANGNLDDTKIDFHNNESYRKYVMDLGFELCYYPDEVSFFNKDDFDHFKKYARVVYDKDNPDHLKAAEKLINTIWHKTLYWADKVAEKTDLYFEGRKNWLERGWDEIEERKQRVARFKEYTWVRIFDEADKGRGVFFTVGMLAESDSLEYKIDCQFSGSNELSKEQQETFHKMFQEYNLKVHKIPFSKIDSYTWESLINETAEYIESTIEIYHDILDRVWKPKQKLARITWNSNGWIKPSGREGKSINQSHENYYGYGHEEWLFDKTKLIDGYHYGFLEPVFKYYSKYEGRILDISLFTIDGSKKQRFWVGTLENVEVITKEESERAFEIYKANGWFNEMIQQIKAVGGDEKGLLSWVDERPWALFNVRFSCKEIDCLPTFLVPVDKDDKLITSSRYNLLNIDSSKLEKIKSDAIKGFSFDDSGTSIVSNKSGVIIRRPVKREIEIEQTHSEIQDKLLKVLQKQYGKDKVKKECRAFGFNRIDLVRQDGNDYIFYEIKTYSQLLTGLRVALGQLLEYAFYPNVINATKLVLVSNRKPDEEFKCYLKHLNSIIKIPVSYIHFCEKEEKILEEL
ncbi:hypothetical protein [Sporocytophaga myxococcoides]|uniref:hypothetical protein n=1 Tax=Sporocytophaga myxococcoides TaxID=153721 RepID=UPI00041D80CD|nr:hypothetical protein [Sporocytophaga myxococcoides]